MRELTIEKPFSKEEINELESQFNQQIDTLNKKEERKSFFIIFSIIISFIVFLAIIFSPLDRLPIIHQIKYLFILIIGVLPSPLFYINGKSTALDPCDLTMYIDNIDLHINNSLEIKDQAMALFVDEIIKQERQPTKTESNFLDSYYWNIKGKQYTQKVNEGFSSLLDKKE